MSLTDKISLPKFSIASPNRATKSIRDRLATGSVEWSVDLARVLALPRRPKPDLGPLVDRYTLRLKKPEGTMVLRPVQAWGLYDAETYGGMLGPIGTGHGKELLCMLLPMVMPECKRAVLLLPPDLRSQFFDRDWPMYSQHWELPNLAGGAVFIGDGRPVLHVVAYSMLSSTKSSKILDAIDPDVLIQNECQCLSNFESVRTDRFLRRFFTHPKNRSISVSGTMMSDSIDDSAHFGALALGAGSPFPIERSVVKQWAAALDPVSRSGYFSPGALEALRLPGEDIRSGFRRRLVDTPGVVATDEASIDIPIVISKRVAPPVPKEIKDALSLVRHDWIRPDGEVYREAIEAVACARQLAAGFYLFWRFPRDEPRELKDAWFNRRQEWNRELRAKLQNTRPYLDSPKLCQIAADLYYRGGCPICHRGPRQDHARGCSAEETHPLWEADCWLPWAEIKDQVFHVTACKWLDEFLVRDAAEWALERPGIVWVEHIEVGKKLAQLTGLPYYAGGKESSRLIALEDGSRSVIASVKANHKGKNLQHAFHRNLVVSISAEAAIIEQYLARTHRPGQLRPEVTTDVYTHTTELVDALKKARERAKFIHTVLGSPQKLVYGRWTFDP